MAKVKSVVVYLVVRGADAAIAFYKKAFGATETMRLDDPKGRIGHAELAIGGAPVMLADEYPEFQCLSPLSIGGTGCSVHLEVDDCDAVYKQAVAAGATTIMPPSNMFYGHRFAKIRDPFGHEWGLGQELEKLSTEEMQKRFNAL